LNGKFAARHAMELGRFLLKLVLLAGVIVSLGLSYVTSPAAEQPTAPTAAAIPGMLSSMTTQRRGETPIRSAA